MNLEQIRNQADQILETSREIRERLSNIDYALYDNHQSQTSDSRENEIEEQIGTGLLFDIATLLTAIQEQQDYQKRIVSDLEVKVLPSLIDIRPIRNHSYNTSS